MRHLILLFGAFGALIMAAGCSPMSNLTAAETAYLEVLDEQADALDGSFDRFAEVMDPTNGLSMAGWSSAIQAEAALWSRLYHDARRLTPPERFTKLHTKNLEMLGILVAAGKDLSYAPRDPLYLGSGMEKFFQAHDMAGDVEDLIKGAR